MKPDQTATKLCKYKYAIKTGVRFSPQVPFQSVAKSISTNLRDKKKNLIFDDFTNNEVNVGDFTVGENFTIIN